MESLGQKLEACLKFLIDEILLFKCDNMNCYVWQIVKPLLNSKIIA